MTDRNNHYVPDKRQYGTLPDLVPITSADVKRHVLVDENMNGETMRARRGIAWGLADESNRRPKDWQWVNYENADGPHWARFAGHEIIVDVDICQKNVREVNSWKGRDEVRGLTIAKVRFNDVPVWVSEARDVPTLLLKLHNEITELLNLNPLIWHLEHCDGAMATTANDEAKRFGIVGRKIYYLNYPAIITSLIKPQGCVMINPDPAPWPKIPWRQDDESNDSLKVSILSPHIWWWRDE